MLVACSDAGSPAAGGAGAAGTGGGATTFGGSSGGGVSGTSAGSGVGGSGIGGAGVIPAGGLSGTGGVGGTVGTSGAAGSSSVGGASGSSGAGGASGAGGSAGGGAVGCAAMQLCDDFEGAPPGDAASAWKIIKNGGYALETVTTQAHSGTHSVHAMATAGSGYAYIEETKTFPAMDFWGRAFMRFQAPSGGHEVFAGLDTNANEAQGEQVRLLNNLGGGKVSTNRRSNDNSKTSSTSIPMGTWFCYEWHETPNELHIFLDGKELTDVGEPWVEPAFVSLVLGFERFSGGMPGDVWIDDVAINSTQVGCN